ncbi:Endonuclease/exonuclease/phosphatase [Xylariomycetidae sp. FL0641]|nr:Endonuclease/exonuclease/phosphatase [Xylariomycetidae sp. FL0641]
MEPAGQDGPDGSSLKPVSSLRSHFENMGKGKETEPSASTAAQPPSREQTPSPKPPPVPDTRPARPPKPSQEEGKSRLQLPSPGGPPSASHSPRLANPPSLSPRPNKPPAVLIEPPHSPPKSKPFPTVSAEASNRLDPDPSKGVSSPVTPSPKPFRIASRPDTPILEPGRSPRLSAAQPPSPPPPRRSAELRREREARPAPAVPPPINRAEKPSNRLSALMDEASTPRIAERRSPFSSPPSSPEREVPPVLPTRPARPPRPVSHTGGLIRTNTLPATFDPPPLHPSIANRRKDQESNGYPMSPVAPQYPEERPTLPVRPQVHADTAAPKIPANNTKPPPRPPRLGAVAPAGPIDTPAPSSQSKRILSNPGAQAPPPPSRGHGRSMTVDRAADRARAELREPLQRLPTNDSPAAGPPQFVTAYPDSTRINRRPPYIKQGMAEIYTKYDTRIFDVCGQYVCTSGHLTRVWSLLDGEQLLSFAYGEGVKATAVSFKPGIDVNEEGQRLWIGNSVGELLEADIASQSIIGNKVNAHGRFDVIKIFRHFNEMWTLDDGGTLHVWGPDSEGLPNLSRGPHQTYRLPKGHTFSMIVGEELWHATGKEIRIFAPSVDGKNQLQVLMRPLVAEGAGDITSGTLLKSQPGKVFFGHVDGKISIFSSEKLSLLAVLNISTYKINSLAGVGKHMWAAYNTGRMCVYDVESSPWTVKKDWQAHDNPALKILADPSSFYRIGRQQVISLGADNMVRAWDGLLQDDYLEDELKSLEPQFCQFQDIKLLALTWNAGASTPSSLRHSESDATFIQNLLQSSGSPDILVFGFQELVDLEDKTATAKRLFKKSSKKKDATDQERMSHQYRDWRDFLIRSLDDYMPADHLYHLLQTATLVGLFTCIFVKSSIRDRIRNLGNAEIKRGMGGLHGNKGAIIVRFMIDDTSLCFINCHLAAGQSQANSRHNDIAAIMESAVLPVERDPSVRIDSYIGGGDGSMVLDHELCLLNGDLNYRIDTMSRDTVVYAVKAGNLTKLLERDQLLVARRRNPAFKLRAFDEAPIQFAPTYKYDVGTDNYDTSEKKRSPAWCDRLLHRGSGRIQQVDYRRHEVRVSDHRPVTGRFKFTVKTISPKQRTLAWADCQQRFEDLRGREADEEQLLYLMNVIGYDETTSKSILRDRAGRRDQRSPSRPRD